MIEETNKRMPLSWTAKGKVMIMEDLGACGFFQLLQIHLLYLGSLCGQFTETEREIIARNTEQLGEQRLVTLRLELQENQLRVFSKAFGAFGRFNMLIPYRDLIGSYLALKQIPADMVPVEHIEVACRGAELLINAIERKAPGLAPRLVTDGLPNGFSFESWPYDVQKTVPGQILRVLPSSDFEEILVWLKTGAYAG